MKSLQCEFCGGKLMAKVDGILECTSCGMLYDKSRVQEMIQEIKGIVQVEGLANAESLLKRGNILLEDGEWTEAVSCFEKVLSIEPENARAYLGELLAARNLTKIEQLVEDSYSFANDKNWLHAKDFADSVLMADLETIEAGWSRHQDEVAKKVAEQYIASNSSVKILLIEGGKNRLKALKEIRRLTGADLSGAIKLFECTPAILKESINEAEALQIKETFESIGATIEIKQ